MNSIRACKLASCDHHLAYLPLTSTELSTVYSKSIDFKVDRNAENRTQAGWLRSFNVSFVLPI